VRNLSPANWHIECLATKLSSFGQNNFKKHSISASKRLNISIESFGLLIIIQTFSTPILEKDYCCYLWFVSKRQNIYLFCHFFI